jgi:tetratricopeptide (TPR) repeat protein
MKEYPPPSPPPPPSLEALLSSSFEENEVALSKLSVRKHFASRLDLILDDESSTVFERLRMNERAMLLKCAVDFARGGVAEDEVDEEKDDDEEEVEEDVEDEKKKKSERAGATTATNKKKISTRKKATDFFGRERKSGEDEDDGSASLVTREIPEKDAVKFLELAEKCVLFAKEEEYDAHLANASARAKKAFAVVARSYVKTLREVKGLERAFEPLKYALRAYSTAVSRGKVTFLHALCYETCTELNREQEAYEGELLFAVEDPSDTGFMAKDFANYCYYAGLSCLSAEKYDRAISFFSNCVSMPTKEKCGQVQIESYKKLLLASIIRTGETSTFLSEKNGIPAKTSHAVRQMLMSQTPFMGVGGKRVGRSFGTELADAGLEDILASGDFGDGAEDPNRKHQSNDSSQDDEMKNEDEDEHHRQQRERKGDETPEKMKMKFEVEGGAFDDDIDSSLPPAPRGEGEEDAIEDAEKKQQQQNKSPYQLLVDALSSKSVRGDKQSSTPLQRFTETMKKYSAIFENDKNADLVLLAHKSVQLAQVRKVAETYSSLSLEAIAREMQLEGGESEAKMLVNEMVARSNIRGGVSAEIDDQNMVTFHDQVEDAATKQKKLETTMADVEKMTNLIKEFDESMLTDEKYFAKFYERQMQHKRNGSAKGGERGGRRAPLSALMTGMATATPIEGGGDEDIAMF